MRVLVTGGLGFIGHNVAHQLEQLGHEPIIVDNRTNYGFIPYPEISHLVNERKQKIKTDAIYMANIEDKGTFFSYLYNRYRPEIVIHLASYPNQKTVAMDPIFASRVMSEGLINQCELACLHEVKRFVYVSSSMVYGNFVDNVPETSQCSPIGEYGILKYAGERLVKSYSDRGKFNHTIVRPSAVYGPADVSDRVIAKFMLAAMRDETLVVHGAREALDFTYVEDAAAGIVGAALSDIATNRVYNVTRGRSRTILEAAEIITKIAGSGKIEVVERNKDFPLRGTLNISKAARDFGFDPQIDIEEGFRRYYDYIQHSSFWTETTIR